MWDGVKRVATLVTAVLFAAVVVPAQAAVKKIPSTITIVDVEGGSPASASGVVGSAKAACEKKRTVTVRDATNQVLGATKTDAAGVWTVPITLSDGDISAEVSKKTITLASGKRIVCLPDEVTLTISLSVSEQIAAVRAAPDGIVDLPVEGATVTYTRSSIGGDPAGFFVQGAQNGPALFVAIDTPTLSPQPVIGDIVSFDVAQVTTVSSMRHVTAISGYVRNSTGGSAAALVQDLSNATDVVSALSDYESELIDLTGTIDDVFSSSGGAFMAAPISTAGILGDPDLRLRTTLAVKNAFDLQAGCSFTLDDVPMWRFNAVAQPTAISASELTDVTCPAPRVTSAVASSATTVVVNFDRTIDAASLFSPATQFTFDNGLSASGASVSGTRVTVTTTTQNAGTGYTVTVAGTVTDIHGTAVDPAADSATFEGFSSPTHLVINEVDYDQPSLDTAEFVEIFNPTASAVNLSDVRLSFVNGTGNTEYLSISLAGAETLAAGGYLLVANSGVPGADITFSDGVLQNGPDAIGLYDGATLIDGLSYEGSVPGFVEGTATTATDDGVGDRSLARLPNGSDTNNATTDWSVTTTLTPRAANA